MNDQENTPVHKARDEYDQENLRRRLEVLRGFFAVQAEIGRRREAPERRVPPWSTGCALVPPSRMALQALGSAITQTTPSTCAACDWSTSTSGLSTVSLDQLAEARQIAPAVCVQNFYNIANRADEPVLALTAEQHIAYVCRTPVRRLLAEAVGRAGVGRQAGDATLMAVAQPWLLQHSRAGRESSSGRLP